MSTQAVDRPCPRCKVRLRPPKSSYCRACKTDHQAERRAGLHQRGRLCAACGEHFEGRGDNQLCSTCRLSYRARDCTKCDEQFWGKGASSRCPKCVRAWTREWGRVEARIAARRDRRFGLAPGQYDQMLVDQNGCCASCREPFGEERSRKPCVDHDRACCDWQAVTGRPICGKCVRGILCWSCNVMLGLAKDDPKVLGLGAEYLERWAAARVVDIRAELLAAEAEFMLACRAEGVDPEATLRQIAAGAGPGDLRSSVR